MDEDFELDFEHVGGDTLPGLAAILNEADSDDEFTLDSRQLDSPAHSTLSTVSTDDNSVASASTAEERSSAVHRKSERIIKGRVMSKLAKALAAKGPDGIGRVTAMTVNKAVIVIGTSTGSMLIFDSNQVLRSSLNYGGGSAFGAVTCVAVNETSTRALTGFEKGQIVRWDIEGDRALHCIPAAATSVDSSVLGLGFTDDPSHIFSYDTHGSVFMHHTRTVLGMRYYDTTNVYESKTEVVCLVRPLLFTSSKNGDCPRSSPPPNDVTILALASMKRIMIASVRPECKIYVTVPCSDADGSHLPSLAWRLTPGKVRATLTSSKSSSEVTLDSPSHTAVLALSWGSVIRFLLVTVEDDAPANKRLKFKALQSYHSKGTLVNIQWVTNSTLLCVDNQERANLIDFKSRSLIDLIDFSKVRVTRNYLFSVTQMKIPGHSMTRIPAYDASIDSIDGNVYILGANSVHEISLVSWLERLDAFVVDQNFFEALLLAVAFRQNKALAVFGFSEDLEEQRRVLQERILQLILQLVDSASQTIEHDFAFFESSIRTVIRVCGVIGEQAYLFGEVFERLQSSNRAKSYFLEFVEPFVQDGKFAAFGPCLIDELFVHLLTKEKPALAEALVLGVDLTKLNIHVIDPLCWQHGLYDAYLFIRTNALRDYLTPLHKLLHKLFLAISHAHQAEPEYQGDLYLKMTPADQLLGLKLLVFISNSLAGLASPKGATPVELRRQVREDFFRALMDKDLQLGADREGSTSTCVPYLFAHTLLRFNVKEFLNVVALSFSNDESPTASVEPSKQAIVDIFQAVMISSDGDASPWFSPEQLGVFFTFLARQMTSFPTEITIDKSVFEHVLKSLTAASQHGHLEERQQALLDLLACASLQGFDEVAVLLLAEQAKFFRVCEWLYRKQRMFGRILECFLRDTARHDQVFDFLAETVMSSNLSQKERADLRGSVMLNIEALTQLDSLETGNFVVQWFGEVLDSIVQSLSRTPSLHYKFLFSIFLASESSLRATKMRFPYQATLMDLMCQYEPSFVLSFLQSHPDYELSSVLTLCRKYNVTEATAWLLEQAGDLLEAYKLLFASFSITLPVVVDSCSTVQDRQILLMRIHGLRRILASMVSLLSRISSEGQDAQREAFWVDLLGVLIATRRTVSTDSLEATIFLRESICAVVHGAYGFVSFPLLLQAIVQGQVSTITVREAETILLDILKTFDNEETILRMSAAVLRQDLINVMLSRRLELQRPTICRERMCRQCLGAIGSASQTFSGAVVVFQCGHAYHAGCVQMVEGPVCVVCRGMRARAPHATELCSAICRPAALQSLKALSANPEHATTSKGAGMLVSLPDFAFRQIEALHKGRKEFVEVLAHKEEVPTRPRTRTRAAHRESDP
eukprot:m.89745 g.89745  ORF g.89745 m.89745 type:complete len:1381 (-) comp51060_c0_seq1:59-4201(-)